MTFAQLRTVWLLPVALALLAPAKAVEITRKGNSIIISGPIKFGDDIALKELLESPQGAGVKLVVLHNSPGGYITPAYEMAREIRKRGLTTLVDASRSYCSSACTGLFVAGVSRHYTNTGGITDRAGGKSAGLQFHEGSSTFSGRRVYSGPGTAQMLDLYYEMGAGGAAKVVSNSDFKDVFRLSGQTALSLGIATSLSPP